MRLLLDEYISPAVARGLVAASVVAIALRDWRSGAFLEVADDLIIQAAHTDGLTLVTYDLRTIPPLLKSWGEQGVEHGGVIFVDEHTIAQNDIGALIRALARLVAAEDAADWTNRIVYLTR
ncbi:MAG TPA: DUF5615 family PIN-like protein [Ktedonobacterales bacterium]